MRDRRSKTGSPRRSNTNKESYGRNRYSSDRAPSGSRIRQRRKEQERAGLQGGAAGRAQAAGTVGNPDERAGGGKPTQPAGGGRGGTRLDRQSRTATPRRGEDRSGVQSGTRRHRAYRRRTPGGAGRERRNAGQGIPHQFRQRESGVSAGSDCGGNRDDGNPEGPGGGQRSSEYRPNPPRYERGTDAAGT